MLFNGSIPENIRFGRKCRHQWKNFLLPGKVLMVCGRHSLPALKAECAALEQECRIVTVSGEFEEFLIWLADLAQNQPYTLIHCSLGIIELFVLAGCLIEFWIVRRIITKKLNLE